MPYYIIKYDYGYGPETEVVEAESLSDANQMAYEAWKDRVESNADYSAELATYDNVSGETFEDPADYGLTEE